MEPFNDLPLLMDFCNIKDWTTKNILNLHKKHRIIHTQAGSKYGFEKFCFPKQDKRKRYFALIEDQNTLELKRDLERRLSDKDKPHIVLPSEKQIEDLWEYLKHSQYKYIKFLRSLSTKDLDIHFINELIDESGNFGIMLINSKKQWSPNITYKADYLSSLEDYINWEIFNIAISPNSTNLFPFIKECKSCKIFYRAKIKRDDQKYCPICSRRSGMRTNVSSEEWNQYMRDWRNDQKLVQREKEIERTMKINKISRKKAEELLKYDKM